MAFNEEKIRSVCDARTLKVHAKTQKQRKMKLVWKILKLKSETKTKL